MRSEECKHNNFGCSGAKFAGLEFVITKTRQPKSLIKRDQWVVHCELKILFSFKLMLVCWFKIVYNPKKVVKTYQKDYRNFAIGIQYLYFQPRNNDR